MQLSTEQAGGVGAEDAMASGQVDMAGAWYEHTIDFQQKGKAVEDVVQLSGAPGERIMCAKGTSITSPAQWKGKTIGVTDLGSGTDAARPVHGGTLRPDDQRLHSSRRR